MIGTREFNYILIALTWKIALDITFETLFLECSQHAVIELMSTEKIVFVSKAVNNREYVIRMQFFFFSVDYFVLRVMVITFPFSV